MGLSESHYIYLYILTIYVDDTSPVSSLGYNVIMGSYQEAVTIPTIDKAYDMVRHIPRDVRYIMSKGNIGTTQLARTMGVNRRVIQRWRKGTVIPRDPFIVFIIMTWADHLRKQP